MEGWGNDVMGRMGEAEKIDPGFLDQITGKKGSLTVNGFNGISIYVNDYTGTEILATVYGGRG